MTTQPINDIDLTRWRESDLYTESLWLIQNREKGNGHTLSYHGNFVPQIPHQLMRRYTRPGEIVLDPFLGGGTTAIEARNLGRRCIGIDLNPALITQLETTLTRAQGVALMTGDSTDADTYDGDVRLALAGMGATHVQLVILHPPYHDIIRFSEHPADLSNQGSVDAFSAGLEQTIKLCHELLEPKRYMAIVMGDIVTRGKYIPLAFQAMQSAVQCGLELRQIIVKNMAGNEAKGQRTNLWRYRSLKNGTYIFKHEYIILLRRRR